MLRWSLVVAIGSLLVIGRTGFKRGKLEPVATYQVRFRELTSKEQRIYREMGEGLSEAERVRGEKGAWPSVARLAADGIPPFAPDPLARDLTWSLRREGSLFGYVGESGSSGPAYLIWIQEPEPGVPGDPPNTPADEVHHPIAGGIILHVGSWIRARSPAPAGVPLRPWMHDWKQVIFQAPPEVK